MAVPDTNMFGGLPVSAQPLKFALVLRLVVERTCRSWSEAAQKCRLPVDRLERIARGENEPRAGDVLRIMEGLGIRFKSSDFDERGLGL